MRPGASRWKPDDDEPGTPGGFDNASLACGNEDRLVGTPATRCHHQGRAGKQPLASRFPASGGCRRARQLQRNAARARDPGTELTAAHSCSAPPKGADRTSRIRRSLPREQNTDVAGHRCECRSERLLESAVFQQTQGRVDEEQLGPCSAARRPRSSLRSSVVNAAARAWSLAPQALPGLFRPRLVPGSRSGPRQGRPGSAPRRLRDEWLGELEQRPDCIRLTGTIRIGPRVADGSAGASSPDGGDIESSGAS